MLEWMGVRHPPHAEPLMPLLECDEGQPKPSRAEGAWRCRQGSSCSGNGPSGSSWGEMGSRVAQACPGSAVPQNLLLSGKFGDFFVKRGVLNH